MGLIIICGKHGEVEINEEAVAGVETCPHCVRILQAENAELNQKIEEQELDLIEAKSRLDELRRKLESSEAHCYDVESGEVYLQLKAQRDALAAVLRKAITHSISEIWPEIKAALAGIPAPPKLSVLSATETD